MPMLPHRDLAATIAVAALVALHLLFIADSNFLPIHGASALTLVLTGATVVLVADEHTTWLTPLLAVPAVVCAAIPATLLLTISVGATLTLWCIELAEHVTFTPRHASDRHSGGAAHR
ncbi:hypothetical protein [Kribbella sp. NPDC048928]|uniref:hypothetical protein n=1 Tax=Kribbella sp. NPDC048928 TaxID=3364111 RepID=UPI0037183840